MSYFFRDEPMKVDSDVFEAIGEKFVVDETKYPLVSQWHRSMKVIHAKSIHASIKKNFRIFTPKLKTKSAMFGS
jgi:hypothetical protein